MFRASSRIVEEQSFEYTDDKEQPADDDGDIALENAYYNAKSEHDAGELDERGRHLRV